MYAAYDIAGTMACAALLPFVPVLALTRYGVGLAERCGVLPAAARHLQRPLWLHAASVGEVLATEPLVRVVRQHRPDIPLLLTTMTVPGRETARARLPVDAVLLLPLDVSWLIGRVMRTLRPRCLVLVETELWPALLRAAARHGVARVLVSGRISARAAARYAWVGAFTRAVLSQINAFAMQTESDAERIIALGAAAERVRVLGSLKYARGNDAAAASGGAIPVVDRPLLIAASTHPGEERMVLEASAGLWAQHPDLLVLIAPRRPERFDEVGRLLEDLGIACERRSRTQGRVRDDIRVLLLDTLGELPAFMPAARAVFVGGTIAPVGGHNISEPALFGKPAAFGPHTEGVAAAAEALLQAGGAVRVHDAAALAAEWRRCLDDPEHAARMGATGRAVIASGAEVVTRTFELLRPYLDERDTSRRSEKMLTSLV